MAVISGRPGRGRWSLVVGRWSLWFAGFTSDQREVEQWFDREYGIEVDNPNWHLKSLQGANRCTLLDRPVAASYLDTDDRFSVRIV